MSRITPDEYDVACKDKFSLSPVDLSKEQKTRLKKLNDKLADLEKNIKREALSLIDKAEPRVADQNDWVEDYEIECFITLSLREDDPDYCEDSDNILVQLWEIGKTSKQWEYGVGDGNNHNEFAHWNHPMKDEYHCWLFYCLYDHTDLGWINMLRIGFIWVDVEVIYQKFVSL